MNDSQLIWEAYNKGIDRDNLINYLKSLGMTSRVVGTSGLGGQPFSPPVVGTSGLGGQPTEAVSTLWTHPSEPLRVQVFSNFVQVTYRGFGVSAARKMFTDKEHAFTDVFDFIQDAIATEPDELSQDEIDKVRGSIDYES